MADDKKSFTTSRLTLVLLIVSILFLLGVVVYRSAIKKEPYTSEIVSGLTLIIFGILGVAGVLFGLWTGRISTFVFYTFILYLLSPIAFGAYLVIENWNKKETFMMEQQGGEEYVFA